MSFVGNLAWFVSFKSQFEGQLSYLPCKKLRRLDNTVVLIPFLDFLCATFEMCKAIVHPEDAR